MARCWMFSRASWPDPKKMNPVGSAVVSPIENVYLKLFEVMHRSFAWGDWPAIGLVQGYASRFPDEAGAIYDVFLDVTPEAIYWQLLALAVAGPLLRSSRVQAAAMDAVRAAARKHQGHAYTRGHSYQLLDDVYYGRRGIADMTLQEAVPFVGRGTLRGFIHRRFIIAYIFTI